MGKPGLRKVHRYSVEFKVTAVKLSYTPGVEVQTVADAPASSSTATAALSTRPMPSVIGSPRSASCRA